jgi:uncharacterized protein
MKVALRDLPMQQHVELSSAFVRDALAGLALRDALDRPADDPGAGLAETDLDFYIEGKSVFARGRLRGWFEVACSRCLTAVRVPMDEAISVTFLPKDQLPEDDDDEVELGEEDLDLYGYEGDEIDLEPLLREQVLLAVPYAPLCKTACAGLCPRCGTDLNAASCDCDRDVPDPRLAALKNIKL